MSDKQAVDLHWLCNWLEENSSGIYRPAKEAAHVIRSMSSELESLRAQLKGVEQSPAVDCSKCENRAKPYKSSEEIYCSRCIHLGNDWKKDYFVTSKQQEENN